MSRSLTDSISTVGVSNLVWYFRKVSSTEQGSGTTTSFHLPYRDPVQTALDSYRERVILGLISTSFEVWVLVDGTRESTFTHDEQREMGTSLISSVLLRSLPRSSVQVLEKDRPGSP